MAGSSSPGTAGTTTSAAADSLCRRRRDNDSGVVPTEAAEVRQAFVETDLPELMNAMLSDVRQQKASQIFMNTLGMLIRQGAVRIDGERVSDPGTRLARGTEVVLQVGKRRFARVTIA